MPETGGAILFDSDDKFRSWLAARPERYVLNVRSTFSPDYSVLHRATCPHISLDAYDPGALTQKGYRKVGADRVTDLASWVAFRMPEAWGIGSVCKTCKPEHVEEELTARSALFSDVLKEGEVYSRTEDLAPRFRITDATLNTGVFQPKGSRSIWLFVTLKKTSDRTQYVDRLEGDVLHWEGQTSGRSDARIINHEADGNELLVFYRESKQQHPHAGFTYEGRFQYLSHEPGNPSSFVLQRLSSAEGFEIAADVEPFDPADIEDGRRKVLAKVARRQGQPKFRRSLLAAYDGQCAITGCPVEAVLEAAHIHPYQGDHTNDVTNGLLLRADLHTLFDLKLLWVDEAGRVELSTRLKSTPYWELRGSRLRLPKKQSERPSEKVLKWHRQSVSGIPAMTSAPLTD